MPNDSTAWVYRNLHKAVQTAIGEFGVVPAQQIKVAVGGNGATLCNPSTASSCYQDGSNRILLSSASNPFTGGDVYSNYASFGRFFMTHELGHAFEYQAIEPPGSYDCPDHSLETPTSRECAWAEGFADWFATRYEGDLIYVDYLETYHSPANGLVTEWGVAATLHDWFDGMYTPDGTLLTDDDGVEWPVTYLKSQMQTCAAFDIYWRYQINGLDMLITCMEHNVNARLEAPAYYQNTWRHITDYSESATEPSGWTAAKVRQMWQYDLYTVGSLP
jgi:hypothetical protein